MGSDDVELLAEWIAESFNPRSRMGSDGPAGKETQPGNRFQSTLPYGERPGGLKKRDHRRAFQSTLPYGERPSTCKTASQAISVSIHAPVWGATGWHLYPGRPEAPGFNPRSRMGSDDAGRSLGTVRIRFNPRSRMGSDNCRPQRWLKSGEFQSTLPYGERPNTLFNDNQVSAFQSTLPYGERQKRGILQTRKRWFQSTLPYGERPGTTTSCTSWMLGFNPRSRMGSDALQSLFCMTIIVSIHAPVWGATRNDNILYQLDAGFQSTLPYGERRIIGCTQPRR